MSDLMQYKGYHGSVHFDEKDLLLYGKIEFIRALISYEATNAKQLRQAFEEAVDDYIEICETQGIEPETPFKGSLNIRLGRELHRKTALAAMKNNISINAYIKNKLEENPAQLDRHPLKSGRKEKYTTDAKGKNSEASAQ